MTQALSARDYWVYFGTSAEHIYVSSFDTETGMLSAPRQVAKVGRPGFLAIHPSERFLYAVGREESDGDRPTGFAHAYTIDREDGSLRRLNRVATTGVGAAHVAVDSRGRALVAANYFDGNVVSMTLESDGRLGRLVSKEQHVGSSINPDRQGEPHPHSSNFSPDDRWVVVPDLGTDELVVYRINPATAELKRNHDVKVMMAPGSGPRHFTFHPNGRWAYAINELGSTVTALEYLGATGDLRHIQTITTLPPDYSGPKSTTAEVLVHPNGRVLYGSNRGDNSLTVFALEESSGLLTEVERVKTGGDWPRNFRIGPSGKYLLAANQRSNDVFVFRIDPNTGKLTATGTKIEMPAPICIRFVAKD